LSAPAADRWKACRGIGRKRIVRMLIHFDRCLLKLARK
jgi:hypothetical protein